jgi:hypothetical protein
MVFDDRDRVDASPATTKTPFEFLDRVSGEYGKSGCRRVIEVIRRRNRRGFTPYR